MRNYPRTAPLPEQPPYEIKRIDGGLNIRNEQSQIADSQSPYTLNMVSDGKGGVQKRKGQQKVYATTLGPGAVNGYFDYRKIDGTVITVQFHGTKIYTQSSSEQPVEIYDGVADQRVTLFVFNDILYILDGTNYLQYDGNSVTQVVGYVPLYTLGRAPSGGGTRNEDLNYLSDSWKDSFSADGSSTVYYLTFTDITSVDSVVVNGEEKTAGTDYSVNLTDGTVTFATAPPAGTDNVVIQATKTGLMDASLVKKNRYVALYGGENDTRVVLTGNPDAPSTVWWSGITQYALDPTYWPESNYAAVGSDADHNTALQPLYDQLILFKERSIQRGEFMIDETGSGIIAFYPINDNIGCDMPYTVQLIDNMIVFCNTYKGPHVLVRTDVRGERNVKPIGGLINGAPGRPGLLDEAKSDLLAATSVDDGTHYILCVGSKAWAWDYKNTPYLGNEDALAWWHWDNINANVWLVRDRELYYGDRDEGLVQKFITNKNDNGVPINGVWRSKLFHFGFMEWLKTIYQVFFRTNVVNAGNIAIKILSDTGETLFTKSVTSNSFNWANWDWGMFTWAVNIFDPVFKLKTKIKKAKYFQIEFSNNNLNEDLSILDLKVYFNLSSKVK